MKEINIHEYLKHILELEKLKFTTQQTISKLQATNFEEQPKPFIKKAELETSGSAGCLSGVLGGILGLVMGCSVDFFAGICFGGFFAWIGYKIGHEIDMKNNESKQREENFKIQTQNNEIERKNKEVAAKVTEKKEMIDFSIKQLQVAYDSTEYTLNKLYSMDIIYPKYRNFVAVASLYEYIDSGRCAELTGADGAYNLFELEIRLDKIITGLDRILSKLDAIMENQFYLYSAIKELQPVIQNISDKIVDYSDKLDNIQRNTAITAYTTQVIEKNQYYGRNWMNGQGHNDHVNMPT